MTGVKNREMAKYEIERKYLLADGCGTEYEKLAIAHYNISQGYLSRRKESTVRVRIAGGKAFLTVKGVTEGAVREEYEYEVPLDDARRMMQMCEGGYVEKVRWIVPWKGFTYEVDIFGGRNAGLKLCEVELPTADTEPELPPFVGPEVTGDPRYYNSNL